MKSFYFKYTIKMFSYHLNFRSELYLYIVDIEFFLNKKVNLLILDENKKLKII